MSNGRRLRRQAKPPAWVFEQVSRCPDCHSTIDRPRHIDGEWRVAVRHDEGCPSLAQRERSGTIHERLQVHWEDFEVHSERRAER